MSWSTSVLLDVLVYFCDVTVYYQYVIVYFGEFIVYYLNVIVCYLCHSLQTTSAFPVLYFFGGIATHLICTLEKL